MTLSKWSPGKVLMTTRPGIPVSPHSPVGQTPILPSRSHYVSQPRSHSQTHTLSPLYLLFVSQVWSMSLSCFSFFLSLSLLPFAPPPSPLFLCRPPWNWSFLSNVFLFDRDVIEDVCLTAVSTEALRVQASLFICVCGHYELGRAVSQGIYCQC